MKAIQSSLVVLGAIWSCATEVHAQEEKKAPLPVAFPKLEKFEPLWKRSIFTTKDLPAPEVPGGPNFVDNLSLSGVYEFDGAVTFVLVDRTTSQFMEARIGAENEMGIKVRQVTPGDTVEKTRIQLQKGDKTGWVGFSDAAAVQPTEVIQRAVIPTQVAPASGTPPAQRRTVDVPPANPILPPPPTPVPPTPVPSVPVNDVPLPPP